jgi:hypothetical protein
MQFKKHLFYITAKRNVMILTLLVLFLCKKDVIEKERRGRMVRMSDSQPEGRGFESRQRHGVVSVSRIP